MGPNNVHMSLQFFSTLLKWMHFLSATTSLCQLDIGFTLDASGSLHDKFSTEKRLTREFVRVLGGIGADTIRAGVVIFSDTAKHIIKLNTHKVREGRRISP